MLPEYLPSPPQGVWHLGPLPIRAYALFIITGIVAALLIGDRRWAARGGQRGVVYDIALWAVPFGLVGGRLYHLATDWRTYWGPGGAGFVAALRIYDGGLGIWGAIALGCVGAWIGCRRRGIPLPAFADAIAPGIILAQAIGRLGNYFNQELYGRETTVPWGLEIFYRRDPSGIDTPYSLDGVSTGHVAFVVQPTFLYELLWNLLVFVALIYADRWFRLGHGRLFALYVAGYCVGRFCIELLRDDPATHIAGIRINSFTSTFVFIGAVVYMIVAPKGREDPASLRGNDYVAEEPAEAEAETKLTEELTTVASASVSASVSASAGTAAAPVTAPEEGEPPDTVTAKQQADEHQPAADMPEAETADTEKSVVAEPEVAEAEGTEAEVAELGPDVAKAVEVEVPEGPEGEEAAAAEADVAGAAEAEVPEGPDGEEMETAEPVAEQAEVAEAEVPEGEGAAAAEADVVGAAEAEAPEGPDGEEMETAEPVAEQAEAVEAEAREGKEAAAAEADVAEVAEADVVKASEADVVEAEEPEAEEPEAEEPEAEEPETVERAAEQAETEEPAGEADSAEPVVEKVVEAPSAGENIQGIRRRWGLRIRTRRSGR